MISDNSLGKLKIKVLDIQEKFDKNQLKPPRSLRFVNSENEFGTIYFSAMSPAGIGINILGRRWYDQYISAGRNVDDQVFYLAFEGELWRKFENRISKTIEKKNIIIKQNNKQIVVTENLFKELPLKTC